VDQGSGVNFQGGLLSGVTYDGTLTMSATSSSVSVSNGLTMTGVSGSGAGAINLTGIDDSINFEGNQTFDNATVTLGSGASGYSDFIYSDDNTGSGAVLTLGPNLVVNANTSNTVYLASEGSSHAGDGIVNEGTINDEASGGSGILDIAPSNFTNQGAINVSSGHTLELEPGSSLTNAAGGNITIGTGSTVYLGNTSGTTTFSNAGKITATGATLYFYGFGNFSNTGTFSVTNSTVHLYGSYTTAALAVFANDGDTIYIDGALTNTGQTLTVGTGSALGTVVLPPRRQNLWVDCRRVSSNHRS
jgi:fibronectin-binding autotransporter adhesin